MKNPYPGLRPFRQDESHLFFGRDGQTDEILARLGHEHFVAIVGVSGCGKSSLINAGVFPGLHGGLLPTGQREWRIARLQPRNQPIRNLAAALLAAGACAADEASDPRSLVEGVLHASAQGLGDLVRGRLSAEGARSCALLIVVDQFEEIFRFSRSGAPGEAAQFVQLLLEAIPKTGGSENQETSLPLYVALAMRSDFLGDCALFPGLPERINRSQYLVPRMTLLQREKAIARPAATEGVVFARPLLDRLLDDVGDDPDQLPILQHALQRTWEAWLRRTGGNGDVGLEDYLAPEVGGMADAINNHAEEAFISLGHQAKVATPDGQLGLIDPDGKTFSRQQRLAGALFRCITEQAEDRRAVRRALPLGTIAKTANVPVAEMAPIIDAFRTQQRTFLTPPEGVPLEAETIIDISHESLIRNWPRLARWATHEALAAGELRRLRHSAAAFRQGNQDPLDRLELARVERWQHGIFADDLLAEPQIVPSAEWARLYLGADAPEAFQEIENYIRESQEQLRRRRRKESIARATRLGLIAFVLLAGVVWRLWSLREQAKDAENQLKVIKTFAETADGLAEPIISNAKFALAQAEQQTAKLIAAIERAATSEPPDDATIEELMRTRAAADKADDAMDQLAHSMENAAKITGDKRLAATATELKKDALEVRAGYKGIRDNNAAAKTIRESLEARLTQAEQALAGLLSARPLDPAIVKAKDKLEIPAATASLAAIDAIRDATRVLGFGEDHFVELAPRISAVLDTLLDIQALNVAAYPQLTTWQRKAGLALPHGAEVNRVRFLKDGKLIASAGEDRNVSFWDLSGKPLKQVVTSSSIINDLAYSAPANALAAAGDGGFVRLLRLGNFSQVKVDAFARHTDSITAVEFSHGGEQVASASADRTVRVFDSRSLAQRYFTSPPLPGLVTSISFHPGDNLVVSGCDDGGVRLHTIDEPAVKLLGKFEAPARRPEFSPDGKLVVAASGDKTVRVWPIVAPREIVNLSLAAPVMQATFRPVKVENEYYFITCATNGEVRLVRLFNVTSDPASTESQDLEPRHAGPVLFATWSTDGHWLATVGGGEVLVWQWKDNVPVARLRLTGLGAATSSAEFSPDAKRIITYGGDESAYLWDLTTITAP
ncbi:MAG TPA: hypothetical protein VNP98_17010 [Chthoniobacterales bacterium]|nr:hypothetical protein [Chthoniobacterales bacterium]